MPSVSTPGCNAKLKNTEGLIPSQIAKNNNQKPAMKELKKAERLEVKFSKPGAVNPNELWALTLHDWSCEHEASLRTAMEIAEEAVGPVETVTRETFVAVLQDHRAPVDDENLQKVILELIVILECIELMFNCMCLISDLWDVGLFSCLWL